MMSLQYLHTALLLVPFLAFICILNHNSSSPLPLHWKDTCKTTDFQNRLVVRTVKYVVLHIPRIIFKAQPSTIWLVSVSGDLTLIGNFWRQRISMNLPTQPKGLNSPRCYIVIAPAHLMRKCCSYNDMSLKFDLAHKRCNWNANSCVCVAGAWGRSRDSLHYTVVMPPLWVECGWMPALL